MQLLCREAVTALGFSQLQVHTEKATLTTLPAHSCWAGQAAPCAAGDSTSGRAVAWKHPGAWTAVPHQHADPA